MAKKQKNRKPPLLTLDDQLRAHDETEPPGPTLQFPDFDRLADPTPERVGWAKERLRLADAILRRDGKRIADPGKVGGSFGVSPYAERGHVVEVAPKDLGKELPKESAFPKRIATQRVIDWYFVRRHITQAEWQAADALWRIWCESGLEAKVTSGYEPVTTNGLANQDHKIAKRVDAVVALTVLLGDAVPYRSRGVVRAVVIEDRSASDWAKGRGCGARDSKTHGLDRLRAGLQALAASLGY